MSRRYRVRMNSEGMWCVEYGDGYTYVSGWRETPMRRIAAALNREGRRCVWREFDDGDGFFWGWRTTCGEEHRRGRALEPNDPADFTYCPHCGAKIERE